jgi:hypothetical protein
MSTYQRRRGLPARVWKTVVQADNRGNNQSVLDTENPYDVTVWVFPQRSARAEVPGQLGINVLRIGLPADLDGVNLFSQVELLGKLWDVVTPPAYHHGTRHTRHWSIDLRERP